MSKGPSHPRYVEEFEKIMRGQQALPAHGTGSASPAATPQDVEEIISKISRPDGYITIDAMTTGKLVAAIKWLSQEKARAVAEEREACVQVIRDHAKAFEDTISSMPSTKLKHRAEGMSHGARIIADSFAIAAAIRARSDTKAKP